MKYIEPHHEEQRADRWMVQIAVPVSHWRTMLKSGDCVGPLFVLPNVIYILHICQWTSYMLTLRFNQERLFDSHAQVELCMRCGYFRCIIAATDEPHWPEAAAGAGLGAPWGTC